MSRKVMGKPCDVVKHDRTGIFLAFKVDSEESFTGYKLTKKQSRNHYKNGIVGSNYKSTFKRQPSITYYSSETKHL